MGGTCFLQSPFRTVNLIMCGGSKGMCRGVQVTAEARGLKTPRGGIRSGCVLPYIGLGSTLRSPARVVCAFNH